jgi:uncharacterized protein with PIN domain
LAAYALAKTRDLLFKGNDFAFKYRQGTGRVAVRTRFRKSQQRMD